MRKVMLAAVLALGGCTTVEVGTILIPIESPAPSRALAVRPGLQRVMSVERVFASCMEGRLKLLVDVQTNTGGWSAALLNPLPSADGLRTFEAVAKPPDGPATMAIERLRIAYDELPASYIERVRVLSQTNQIESEVRVGPCG